VVEDRISHVVCAARRKGLNEGLINEVLSQRRGLKVYFPFSGGTCGRKEEPQSRRLQKFIPFRSGQLANRNWGLNTRTDSHNQKHDESKKAPRYPIRGVSV